MTTQQAPPRIRRDSELLGQTVVLIGGTSPIGLDTARLASTAGAKLILTGRDPDRLNSAANELAPLATAAFDATDPGRLDQFFRDLPRPVDHVLVAGGGPYYASLTDFDFVRGQRDVDEHLWLPMRIARAAVGTAVPGAPSSSWAVPVAAGRESG